MNSVSFTGHLGGAPAVRSLNDGTPVCSFSLAVSRGRDKDPIWLEVSSFGKLAEACKKFLDKGKLVAVTGRLDVREYTARDGSPKTAICVHASVVDFLGEKSATAPGARQSGPPKAQVPSDPDDPGFEYPF